MRKEDKEPVSILLKAIKPRTKTDERHNKLLDLKKQKKVLADVEFFDNSRLRRERGKVLKYLRDQKGLTQAEVATMLDTTKNYYMTIENGGVDVSLHKLDYWMSILGGRIIAVPFNL